MSAQTGHFKTAQMKVDRTFKGDPGTSIELFDDGMCDGPDLEVGRQYLMYTWRYPGGGVPARGCTRSRDVKYAKEDLLYLEQYAAGKFPTHISGKVTLVPSDQKAETQEELGKAAPRPLQGVHIQLSSATIRYQATTDHTGAYRIANPIPGTYAFSAELPGYRTRGGLESVDLAPNGCVESSVRMAVDRRVQGIVRDNSGDPVSNVLVEMIPSGKSPDFSEALLAITDGDGRYLIDEIYPGQYLLGVNIKSTPTIAHPYPRSYYRAASDRTAATVVNVSSQASVQELDIRVPAKLPVIRLYGRILGADGHPPLPEDHPDVRIKGPHLDGQIDDQEINIDADGQFEFELCEGVEYSAFAFSRRNGSQSHSAPVEFTATKANDHLTFILDKTDGQFRQLSRQLRR